ncbi:M20 aminoacylase family protein [Xenophilus sp. Marseille-Q4582]|uniref:M20 aminoacylase family protein n=1 Tax=Xenophilus sp. Marseille-Q4582 TaxID=2866600 RepID=UPI001CE3F217|nr:M20 aminoacylase family protein [Xenophilus sp. Marseille-Q4582]
MNLIDSIVTQAAGIAAVRRDLHAHPELGYEEVRTADVVAAKLTEWGIPIHRGLGKTGVVGILKNGSSTRAVGLRADMDALPIQELNTFAHASRHSGKMHACGHDGHTAMLLAAAQHLAKHRHFDGTVYLIFQPAEEGGGGADAMIKDGLFERFPMDAVYGMHNWPGMQAGQFAVSPGPAMASGNKFYVTVRGKGGHAALPHTGIDPVPIACELVQAWQTIVTRKMKPTDSAVISVTTIHAGDTNNVIPNDCELTGTVRTFSLEVLDLIESRMRQVAEHICAAHDAECDFRFERYYPPTINTPAEADFAREVMAEVVGPQNVLKQEAAMTSEDFAFMLLARPGAYAFIGNGDGTHRDALHGEGPCTLHNPSYDFNDDLIPLGATVWVRLAERFLAEPPERFLEGRPERFK